MARLLALVLLAAVHFAGALTYPRDVGNHHAALAARLAGRSPEPAVLADAPVARRRLSRRRCPAKSPASASPAATPASSAASVAVNAAPTPAKAPSKAPPPPQSSAPAPSVTAVSTRPSAAPDQAPHAAPPPPPSTHSHSSTPPAAHTPPAPSNPPAPKPTPPPATTAHAHSTTPTTTQTTAQAPPPPSPPPPSNDGTCAGQALQGQNSGQGTFYAPGLGSCGFTNGPDDPIVAVSHFLYDSYPGYTGANPNNNPICGRKIEATYMGKTATVTVVDRCTACNCTSLDFAPSVFDTFASEAVGRLFDVTWRFL